MLLVVATVKTAVDVNFAEIIQTGLIKVVVMYAIVATKNTTNKGNLNYGHISYFYDINYWRILDNNITYLADY